jgi:hypothetical protein
MIERLIRLEQARNNAPLLVLEVECRPTVEQQTEIDRAIQTGRRLMVFDAACTWAWMPGASAAPWMHDDEH